MYMAVVMDIQSGTCNVRVCGRIAVGLGQSLAIGAFALLRLRCLHPVPRFDNVRLQRYRSRSAVQLEEQAAGIAQHGARFVAPP